jgi:outer membrane protein assembly factor BamA
MPSYQRLTKIPFFWGLMALALILFSCGRPFVKHPPKEHHYLYKNKIEVKESRLLKTERTALSLRMLTQLEDSSKIKLKKKLLFLNVLDSPFVYNQLHTSNSAANMKASLFHLGYYHALVATRTDTARKKITVTYTISPNTPTRIASVKYDLKYPDLQRIALRVANQSYLKEGEPITKANVITEIARLVDSLRNNGYLKFTAAEIKIKGDTTTEALTSLSNDPFEQLEMLNKMQNRLDSPTINLAVVLNPPSDSSRLQQYHVNRVHIFQDYKQGDQISDSQLHHFRYAGLDMYYHDSLFNPAIIERNMEIKPGALYVQNNYYQTIFKLSKLGAWQSVNIRVEENKDSNHTIDLYVDLAVNKKIGLETALEVSYSAANSTNNVLAGNLFGLSGNISIQNRNLAKQAIRMSHNFRAGIEFNNNFGNNSNIVNSNELGYTNTTTFPRLLFPEIPNLFRKKKDFSSGESFINFGAAYNTRLNLFNLQTLNSGFGWSGNNRYNWKWVWTPLSLGYSNVINPTDSFTKIIQENPFLNYSYNTAFVSGMAFSFSKTLTRLRHPNSLSKEVFMKLNAEESGLTWGTLPLMTRYKRRFIKTDVEVKHTVKYLKSVIALRGFLGIGVPLLGSDTNKTLPLFKQYFGGGSNSMRAWPVRGIGPGGRPISPFRSGQTIYNDRTGDMQLEINAEYRYDIAKIIPNTLTLKGAVFTDIGNVWNIRNTQPTGITDTTQFQLKNLYRQLGVSLGTGLRLDFNYFVVRLDFGFRFKRPELFYINDGWKAPDISINDVFKKILTKGVNNEYKQWRYENFNFAIGIGYAF